MNWLWLLPLGLSVNALLTPGDHSLNVEVQGVTRSCLVHLPPTYDVKKPTPVVLVFHGAMMNAERMVAFCGLNEKADQAGFVAVYPNGTGWRQFLFFNSGGLNGRLAPLRSVDDVKYVAKLLDDLEAQVNVDRKRVYATGMSNGGMMCYRLAAELSDRIAAIAPVSGTLAIEKCEPKRPVPVMHFHGTKDTLVHFHGPDNQSRTFLWYKSVEDTIQTWTKIDGCPDTAVIAEEPDTIADGTRVTKKTYGPGKNGAEVILFVIEGGGHTWPGRDPTRRFLGAATRDISANDLIWEFFERHPLP
jgi:polyhydroxybutyrate depolymerase